MPKNQRTNGSIFSNHCQNITKSIKITEWKVTDTDKHLESAKPSLCNSQETVPSCRGFQFQFSIHFVEWNEPNYNETKQE